MPPRVDQRDFPASSAYSDAIAAIARGQNPFSHPEPTTGLPLITEYIIHTKGGDIVVFDVHGRTDEDALKATLANLQALTGFTPPA